MVCSARVPDFLSTAVMTYRPLGQSRKKKRPSALDSVCRSVFPAWDPAFAGAGSLKPLGVTGSQRSPIFPDLRTFREQGVAGCDLDIFAGAWGPPGLPRAIVDRVNAALRAALGNPAAQAQVYSDIQRAIISFVSSAP